ncbi:phage tail protein [Xenorhabdus sp. Reich]|uniref:Phage tail protein n=1 Tax=Xenorhabdus littoralis TaxID=2582835 RepID=A0ABU4SMX4_9GAMM|nr:phage tail protein [Xenorhabdus sp. Reich]MDX7999965.1 phage tail protein [Xenorhabdus sp. Reich]
MSTKFFALLTQLGADKLANAAALGTKIEITHMAVGDGGGSLPTPDTKQAKLINEKRRAAINTLSIDPKNTNQIIAEQVIPENEGGWWIREIGLFDKDGILIAVGNCAETYKPQLQEGSGRTQTIRMILIVSSADSVTLKVDPSVILATREYVDDSVQKHANSRNHPDATLKEKGFVILSSAVDSNSETHAATPKAVKTAYDFAGAANNNANGRLEKSKNGADIPNKDEFVKNLGITGTELPVGVPVPWPLETPPAGWLKCNGSTFGATQYPELARVYPALRLPDLRGEFLRGWDDGRGEDRGRPLLSSQASTILSEHAGNLALGSGHAIFNYDSVVLRQPGFSRFNLPSPVVGDGVNYLSIRPRNIAFNYIVRAA